MVGETKMDAYSTKDDQHSRNDKSVVIELILNQACMLSTVKIFIDAKLNVLVIQGNMFLALEFISTMPRSHNQYVKLCSSCAFS